MAITYRHSLGPGQHTFYEGVVGEPEWNPETSELTLQFEGGGSMTFGPNPEDQPIAYGRLLFRDEGVDEETGLPRMAESDPPHILFNCTFWPVGE